MPDSLFFSRANLRPSCKRHNLERGHLARLQAGWSDHEQAAPVKRSPLIAPFSRPRVR